MNNPDNGNLLDAVDARTRLAGSNTMELLLFSLGTKETFAINVFKVREITRTPAVTRAPNLPHAVEGVVSLRGSIIPVISLSKLIRVGEAECSNRTMMVTEFSRHVQGFLMNGVDRIVRVDWNKVRAPDPMLVGDDSYITAITELPNGQLVSILDVEHVLATVYGESEVPELEPVSRADSAVFFADDSSVARKEIVKVLDMLEVSHQHAGNGREAWERLQSMASRAQAEGEPLHARLQLILTDAEMPEMDGYVLTRCIKSDARFDGIPVVMHSSLSSEANRSMGKTVGVDAYVAKFEPRVLADTLRPLISNNAAHAAHTPEVPA
ncbi:MAG: fused signal transduction protein/response regulator [Betaproteobacteria bacterium]|nr:fused signal transduction protein/response regulator [Betaproteobacteria bacterium]